MDTKAVERLNKEVAKRLREKHRVSWKKAIEVCGYDFFTRFHETGNTIDRTAYVAATLVKQEKKNHVESK